LQERIVEKMQKLTEAFRGVVELERHRNEGLEEEPLFISWTTDIFCELFSPNKIVLICELFTKS